MKIGETNILFFAFCVSSYTRKSKHSWQFKLLFRYLFCYWASQAVKCKVMKNLWTSQPLDFGIFPFFWLFIKIAETYSEELNFCGKLIFENYYFDQKTPAGWSTEDTKCHQVGRKRLRGINEQTRESHYFNFIFMEMETKNNAICASLLHELEALRIQLHYTVSPFRAEIFFSIEVQQAYREGDVFLWFYGVHTHFVLNFLLFLKALCWALGS